jgi:hypothetical protein
MGEDSGQEIGELVLTPGQEVLILASRCYLETGFIGV